MQLNFLGNTYTKSSDLQVKPDVQLRYQGKFLSGSQARCPQCVGIQRDRVDVPRRFLHEMNTSESGCF